MERREWEGERDRGMEEGREGGRERGKEGGRDGGGKVEVERERERV